MKFVYAALLTLALSPIAPAQVSFDLVYPSDLRIQPAGLSFRTGVLINTGSVPIHRDDWVASLTATQTDLPTNGILVRGGPGNWEVLLPGEAVGQIPGVDITSVLSEGETYIDDIGVLSIVSNIDFQNPLFPPAVVMTSAIETLGRRTSLTSDVTFDGISVEAQAVTRVSSVQFADAVTESTPGCPLPGVAELEIGFVDPTDDDLGPTLISKDSALPVLGNTGFDIAISPPWATEVSALPYVVTVRVDTGLVDLLGCTLPALDGPVIFQSIGQLSSNANPFGAVEPVYFPLPIPNDPVLLGVALQTQWAVLTTGASNGFFATSPSRRFVISSL